MTGQYEYFSGRRLFIDVQRFRRAGGTLITNPEILADMQQLFPEGRVKMWADAQTVEREVLLRGAIPRSAVRTFSATVAWGGVRVVGWYGVGTTVWRLYSATERSVQLSSPRPVLAQTVREAGGWLGALAGAQTAMAIAAGTTWETGPLCPLFVLGAGIIGGIIGLFIVEPTASAIDLR